MANNHEALAEIRKNIAEHGYHIYAVSGGAVPRYVYTIGNLDRLGFELIFAGAAAYSLDEAVRAVDKVALTGLQSGGGAQLLTPPQGRFDLRPVYQAWVQQLMLGAIDHYGSRPVSAIQLVPDDAHHTIDTPDMSLPISASATSAWRWLEETWPYPITHDSVVMTNLAALRGEPVTEAARWEEDEWEIFAGAGPDVDPEDVRAVPLAVLLAFDPSLEPVTRLPVGKALWRDGRGTTWNAWGK